MKVDVQHRPFIGAIWLKRRNTCYVANWYGRGQIRKKALLKAIMRQNKRFEAPWLWD